jgi:hypothetical protein
LLVPQGRVKYLYKTQDQGSVLKEIAEAGQSIESTEK